MKNLIPSLSLLTLAAAASAQTLSRPLPMTAPTKLPYEARALELGQPVSEVQYAILHALLGWKGGANPPYSHYEARDLELLESLGIAVAPIGTATSEQRKARQTLEAQIGEVRARRNGGRRPTTGGKPIGFEKMVAAHKALISGYGSHVSIGLAPADPLMRQRLALASKQAALARALVGPIQEMTAASDEASFNGALARLNAAAEALTRPRHLARAPGESRDAVLARALKIYRDEQARSLTLAREVSTQAYLGVPPDADDLQKRTLDRKFDGRRGGDTRAPAARPMEGGSDPRSETTLNAPALKDEVFVPEDRAVTKRAKDKNASGENAARRPGFFALLGELFKAAARTVSRAAGALVKSAQLVGKALFS